MTSGAADHAPALADVLHRWMPRQRWYPAKGRGVGLRFLETLRLPDDGGRVGLEVHLVGLDSGERLDVVQVPLSFHGAPLEGADPALLGEVQHGERGRRWVYDGLQDPVFLRAWLRLLTGDAQVDGARGVLAAGASAPDPAATARVLGGEQSNTSVVVGAGGPAPVIVKVFRTLHPGGNPDVDVLAALGAQGCARVPRLVGWVEATWDDPRGGRAQGHLAVAAEFLAGSEDAWREAVVAVDEGRGFAEEARGLGAATANVHAALADAFGATAVDDATSGDLVAGLRERVAWAQRSAQVLDAHRAALADHVAALGDLTDLPALQRVHGDLHLGQVLHSPSRGWVLLDFEGEPLRPLAERVRPDLALRDVAGMLRSFDYAARHATVGRDDPAAEAAAGTWAEEARAAFCEGYATESGEDPRARGDLLAALELDKALYEVVYETQNRPDWLPVPLHAVERLLHRGRTAGEERRP